MRILYITYQRQPDKTYLDQSVLYRCYNPAEILRQHSLTADISHYGCVTKKLISCYDVLIFHRPTYSKALERTLKQIHSAGQLYVADFDDLIFNPEYAQYAPLYRMGLVAVKKVKRKYAGHLNALQLFDYISVSSQPLAEEIDTLLNPQSINVFRNGLSASWINQFKGCEINSEYKEKYITYLSGSKSHDHDFKVIESELAEIINNQLKYKLLVVGNLTFNRNRFAESRLICIPKVEYHILPEIMLRSKICLAPLELNIFNECKSAIKFIEAGFFGVPVIATPIEDLMRFRCQGLIFAKNKQEWADKLRATLEKTNPDDVKKETKERVQSHGSCASQINSYKAWLISGR